MAEFTKEQLKRIEQHQYINVSDTDWWSSTYEYFSETIAQFGVVVTPDDIEFSLDGSQGDGACFRFTPVSIGDMVRACAEVDIPLPSPNPLDYACLQLRYSIEQVVGEVLTQLQPGALMDALDAITIVSVRLAHRYSHSRTRRVEMEISTYDFDEDEMEKYLPTDAAEQLRVLLDGSMEHIADCLYRLLQEECDYLTSDEAVWETLEANDMVGEVPRVAA